MLHSLAERIAVFLFDKTDEYPLEIYTYGLELIFSSIAETFVLIVLGVIFNLFLETIIFILSFSFLRFFTGGYHAKYYLKCAIVMVIIYLLAIISYELLKTISFSCQMGLIMLIFLISFVLIGTFAPIENANKRIENNTDDVTESAMAYNAIAVGGASGSSSISAYNGDDLSYKPDIVAPYDMAVKYDDSSNAVIPCNTSSSAGLVTGAMALLMDAESTLITCPHLAKSLLLNGATYYGTKNISYTTSTTNPNPSFVAFDRVTGAGQINIYNSYTNYVSRHWDTGTLSANQETFSGSFYVSGASKEVHVNFCAIKNNTFNGDGSATNSSCPNITLTVRHGNTQWTSTVTTDNKCSIVFTTDSNPSASSGTYSIYLKSNIYISRSALSNMVY